MEKYRRVRFLFYGVSIVLLSLLQACYHGMSPFRNDWPASYYPTQWSAPIDKVYLITNKDTLTGKIKLINRDYFPVIPNSSDWSTSSIINVKINDIQFMRLNDSLNGQWNVLENHRLDRNHLCRLLGKRNNAAIYDNYFQISGWAHKMVLVTGEDRFVLFSWASYHLHFGDVRRLLKKFIKKRYHPDRTAYQHKTKDELILYILDLENNKKLKEISTQDK